MFIAKSFLEDRPERIDLYISTDIEVTFLIAITDLAYNETPLICLQRVFQPTDGGRDCDTV